VRRWALLPVVLVAAFLTPGGADAQPAPQADKVLIVSYPALQWSTVADVAPPRLEQLFEAGAVASLSIRTGDPVTTLADGYVTIGAGNRASLSAADAGRAAATPDGGVLVPPEEVAAATEEADSQLFGAEPGALGDALARAGVATGVVGRPDAALALMDRTGLVTHGAVSPPDVVAAFDQVWRQSRVVLLEPDRGDLGAILDRVDLRRDLVLVVAPVAPGDAAALTVFGAAGPGIGTGLARSATTRRDGYVTLPDVGVTVLDALGVAVPDAMNGTAVTSNGGSVYDQAQARSLAETNTIAVFRDRTVGPVSVTYVVLQVLIYAVAIGALVARRSRLAMGAAVAAMVVLAVPAVTFLAGLFRYDRLGLTGYTLAVFGAAVVLAAAAWSLRRWHPLAPALALVTLNWLVQIIDIVTGGHLQINTTLGYSPIVAGRFQGYGNLAFAIVAATAIVLATGLWGEAPSPRSARDRWWVVAVVLLAITVVADGWPTFGADAGGVLACVPAFALVAIVLGGWKVDVRRAIAVGAGAIAVLALFAFADLARPADQRTHLGRFVADIGNGDAGVVLRRKLEANWHVLTSTAWTVVVPALMAGLVVLAVRRRGLLAEVQAKTPGLRACLLGSLVLAVLGFAFNDSGIAVPAMMIGVVVPWLLLVTLRVAPP
jgi:hypothetical protein